VSAAHRLAQRARQVQASPGSEVPSPCVSICRVDPGTQRCEGCLRTLDEIAAWSSMGDDEKREVWRSIGRRALAGEKAPT
jgi:uncharacterized protein